MSAPARRAEDDPVSLRNGAITPDVAVIGAGAVGVCTALELARAGASVTVLERGPGLAAGCSAGNAGIVGAAHVLPLAGPAVLWEGLRWLGRPDSPFGMRLRPALVPWLARFVAASDPRRVAAARAALRALALESATMHAELHAAGLDTGYTKRGILNVYAGRRALRGAVRDAAADAADGLPSTVVDADRIRDELPGLGASAAGGVFYPQEAHCDPEQFVRAVGEQATLAGVAFRTGVEVIGARTRDGRVTELSTTAGAIRPGTVVIAAGAHSALLARALRIRLPMQGGKGYHVEIDTRRRDPQVPVWLHAQRVVLTPMPGRLRVAGTLELAGLDDSVDQRRVAAVLAAAEQSLEDVPGRSVRRVWRGLRPCSPDGLPIVGWAPEVRNALLATGHGMWGLQLAPVTGRIVSELVGRPALERDLAAISPARFHRDGEVPERPAAAGAEAGRHEALMRP
jgi:D-amino-acid dehydrogenase